MPSVNCFRVISFMPCRSLSLSSFAAAWFGARPEIAAAQYHTDYSRVERVDRVESVAPLDAKRPYSTLMFQPQRTQRSQRKNWLIVAMGPDPIVFLVKFQATGEKELSRQSSHPPQQWGPNARHIPTPYARTLPDVAEEDAPSPPSPLSLRVQSPACA